MEEEMIFTKDDLTALGNRHGHGHGHEDRYGLCDYELTLLMKELSSNFIDPNGVTYGYSVVPRNSDDELYDPRVFDRIRDHLCASNNWLQNHERAAMLNPSLKSKEGYRPFDMKTFEVDPHQVLQGLRNQDLEAASVALAFFNSKFPHQPPYIVEQVFGHQLFPKGSAVRWWHSNFKASRKDGSPSKLFFVEYYDRRSVPFCCILDESSCVRGCHFCGEEVVHPDDDRVLKPEYLNKSDPPARLDIATFMSPNTIVIRDIKDICQILSEQDRCIT